MPRFSSDVGRIAGELPDALAMLDLDGTLTWMNQAAMDLLELDPEEWIGRSVFDLLHPDDHAVVFTGIDRVGNQDESRLLDVRLRDSRGRWRQVELRGKQITGSEKAGDFIIAIMRDVADRQGLELGTGDHNRLRALVHHATALLMTLDADGQILAANGELSRLLHRDPALTSGMRFVELVVPDDRHLVNDALWQSDESTRRELSFDRPDGSTVTLDVTITNLCNDPLVGGFVLSGTDITDLKESQRALRHMADHDALTGLLNRRALLSSLDSVVDDANQHEIVVLFCDLDGFKQVNDQFGHAAGDQILVEVARRLERAIRPGDLLGRLGGDEFVVVLPRANEQVAEQIRDTIRRLLTEPITAGEELVAVDVSIGSATTGDHPTAARLLSTADDAMFAVKRARRVRGSSVG